MEIIQDNWYALAAVEIQDYPTNQADAITEKTAGKVWEILDIYDEHTDKNGKKIYTKKWQMEREEAHKVGALHTGAQIWIYNSNGQVLLQKRAMTVASSPWLLDTSAAWHVKNGKTIITGALDELREEISMIRKSEDLLYIGNYRRETKKMTEIGLQHNNEINKVFLLNYEGSIQSLKVQKEEVSEIKFIALEELESDWKNPRTLALYTSKSQQYREMILLNIKKILWWNI